MDPELQNYLYPNPVGTFIRAVFSQSAEVSEIDQRPNCSRPREVEEEALRRH